MSDVIVAGGSSKITNNAIFKIITDRISSNSVLLDFGAGQGHMSSRVGDYLLDRGMDPNSSLFACDVVPSEFKYSKIKCLKISTNSTIPFDDGFFDIIYAIEVMEHMPRPYDFIKEAYKKLKPGGSLIFSVPNILHMQSRMKFFLSGFGEMFGPLSSLEKNAGRICGHIMPLNYSHFHYGLRKVNFRDIMFYVDRRKKSALFLALLFYPLLKLASWNVDRDLKDYDKDLWSENRAVISNLSSFDVLTSRSCIISAQK